MATNKTKTNPKTVAKRTATETPVNPVDAFMELRRITEKFVEDFMEICDEHDKLKPDYRFANTCERVFFMRRWLIARTQKWDALNSSESNNSDDLIEQAARIRALGIIWDGTYKVKDDDSNQTKLLEHLDELLCFVENY